MYYQCITNAVDTIRKSYIISAERQPIECTVSAQVQFGGPLTRRSLELQTSRPTSIETSCLNNRQSSLLLLIFLPHVEEPSQQRHASNAADDTADDRSRAVALLLLSRRWC